VLVNCIQLLNTKHMSAGQSNVYCCAKHNKLFQPITDKKALGVGFGGVSADEEEGGSKVLMLVPSAITNVNKYKF